MAIKECYLFTQDALFYTYTSSKVSSVIAGRTYVPENIKRGGISLSKNQAKSEVTIEFSRKQSFALGLLQGLPETPISVVIYRDGLPYWQGIVMGVEAKKNTITLSCTTGQQASSTRMGLPLDMSLYCRHTLYGPACGLIQESYKKAFDNVSATSNVITVSGITDPDGYYSGGIAKMSTQTRFIISHTGTTITLASAFTGAQNGTINLYPGCDLIESTCHTKFNNVINFGGFSRIPTTSPFNEGIF